MSSPIEVTFMQSTEQVAAYDFVEVELHISGALPANSFTEASVSGEFQQAGLERVQVNGFCDSPDGTVHRIRFMPARAGEYTYQVVYRQSMFEMAYTGRFTAVDGGRKGIVRVDPAHPFHFIWEGSGEHYFWNGTTTYTLLGCDDNTMLANVDRLARLQVNRLRVGLSAARVKSGREWAEEVYPSEQFTFLLNPWVAAHPESVDDPGFDTSRFNLSFWHKVERLLGHARDKNVQISIVFYVDGARQGVDPFGQGVSATWNEMRFYHYAINRLAAYSNVMWDVTNEWRLFRKEAWVEWMGNLIDTFDPYRHLTSCHGHELFPFHSSPWADFVMYQLWDETGNNAGMTPRRKLQARSGHPKPVINEEYGYEDHYPVWGGGKIDPARSADNRRRLAWQIVMAGCYQTTGEKSGSVGGWINGRGTDDTMLTGYGHMVDFFTGLAWWQMEPHNELVNLPNLCLAQPGKQYVAYLPAGEEVELYVEPGVYQAAWFNPRSGVRQTIRAPGAGQALFTAQAPDGDDWVLLVTQ